jgi:MFS family permease
MSEPHRARDLPVLAVAIGISTLGDWLALIPLNLELRSMGGSGLAVAALFIAVWSPAAVLAAPVGLLVDRLDRRRLLAMATVAQAVVAVGLAYANSEAEIVGLAAVLGVFAAVAAPAEFSLVASIVRRGARQRANSWVETARYIGFVGGPLVAGLVVGAGSVRVALLLDAASFLAVAAAALTLRPREMTAEEAAAARRGRARDGVVYLFRDRALGIVMVGAFLSLLLMTASASAEVFFFKGVLHTSDAGFGFLMSLWPLGMVLGAAVAGRLRGFDLAAAALFAIVIQGAGIAGPAVWLGIATAAVGFLIGGLAHGSKNVWVRTLIQERVPDHLHGRAYAAYNGLRNGAEVVALLAGGVLVAAIGARGTMFLAGAIPAAAGLVCLLGYLRMRPALAVRRPVTPPAP